MKTVTEITTIINRMKPRSAWERGVRQYVEELLSDLDESITGGYSRPAEIQDRKALEKVLLNGAQSWEDFSWGGSALIYNYEIAERLCTPSELRKTRNGFRRPNSREDWLDTQAEGAGP